MVLPVRDRSESLSSGSAQILSAPVTFSAAQLRDEPLIPLS